MRLSALLASSGRTSIEPRYIEPLVAVAHRFGTSSDEHFMVGVPFARFIGLGVRPCERGAVSIEKVDRGCYQYRGKGERHVDQHTLLQWHRALVIWVERPLHLEHSLAHGWHERHNARVNKPKYEPRDRQKPSPLPQIE